MSTLEQLGCIFMETFEPRSSYNEQMDWLIWLDEDVSYISKQVHPMLEILHHPESDKIIGYKILDYRKMVRK